jgi:predicted acyl esterase
MVIDWDIPVAMDDGVGLRADVFRPGGAARSPGRLDPFSPRETRDQCVTGELVAGPDTLGDAELEQACRPCGPAGPGRPTCCCRSFLAS